MCNKLAEGQQQTGNCDVLVQSILLLVPCLLVLPTHIVVVAGNKLNVENNTKMSFQAALTMPRSAQGRELSLRFTWRIMEQHQVPLRAQAGGSSPGQWAGHQCVAAMTAGQRIFETKDTTSCCPTPHSTTPLSLPHPTTLCCDEVEWWWWWWATGSLPHPTYPALSLALSLSVSLGVFLIKNKFRFSVRRKKRAPNVTFFVRNFHFGSENVSDLHLHLAEKEGGSPCQGCGYAGTRERLLKRVWQCALWIRIRRRRRRREEDACHSTKGVTKWLKIEARHRAVLRGLSLFRDAWQQQQQSEEGWGPRCAEVCAGEMVGANDSIRVEHATPLIPFSLCHSHSFSFLPILISVNCVLHLSKTFEYLMEITLEKRWKFPKTRFRAGGWAQVRVVSAKRVACIGDGCFQSYFE